MTCPHCGSDRPMYPLAVWPTKTDFVFSKLYGDPSEWEWHSNKQLTKLERAQAYALEVRKRKFQVKRITGDQP